MTIEGIVENGTIVLPEGVTLPEGARVEVTVKDQTCSLSAKTSTIAGLLKFAGVLSDLPADFASEHDHYIHGTPKQAAAGD